MQDKYQQLQEYLNKQIEKGRKPRGVFYKITKVSVTHILTDEDAKHSYHSLFSKDSGLMELVEWKSEKNAVHFIDKHAVGYAMIMDDKVDYHYMIMGPMTADEKIDYFLKNVL